MMRTMILISGPSATTSSDDKMIIRISGIFARDGESVCVCFEMISDGGEHRDTEKFILSAGQLARLGLSKGECDKELYETVCNEAKLNEAMRRAMRSLEYGSCSKKALKIKLIRSGFDKDVASEVIKRLEDDGLLDDTDTACREAERDLKKLWGRRRIEAELYKKGYGAESVRAALRYIDRVGADYVANCKRLINKKLRASVCTPDEQKKLYAALARYGYSQGEIRQAMCELDIEDE